MSLPLPPSTPMTKKYMRSFWLRLIVFLFVVVAYVMKSSELDFTTHDQFVSELSLLWLAMLVSMLSQLNPNSALTTGCHKQHSTHFEPVPDYDPQQLAQALRREQRGAMRVAAVWLAINALFGVLYHKGVLGVPELVLLSALAFWFDLVCVLFFCPFQTFLMKNRCCVNCRIFAWGSWMMAAPLMLVPHWYAQSLFWVGVLVMVVWEVRLRRHPERFWAGSNRRLQCARCTEQLCRYKHPRSPRFGGAAHK